MAKQDKPVRPQHAERVIRFLSDGFNDYLAARVLLLSGLLEQGAVLASTAMEKYLKAMLATHGNECHGHWQKAHWAAVRNKYPELSAQFDFSFLQLCQKCYLLRYTDEVPRGYNVVIAAREFLAELDYTAVTMETGVGRTDASGKPVKTRFMVMTEARDQRLLQENHVLSGQDKGAFVYGVPQLVHELRRINNGVIVEVTYSSTSVPENRSFIREAFVQKSADSLSYQLSHLPIQQG